MSLRSCLFALLFCVGGLAGCTGVPDGLTPVADFRLDRYLGKWYEIARLDHSFERGLSDVSARYSLRPDGTVEVVNRGYDAERGRWREAVGHAMFIGDASRGSLKVSFFGPFYGGYHIVALDSRDYRWSLVAGPDRNYLWLLARQRSLAAEDRERLLATARELGFAVEQLIWVEQSRPES